MATEKILNTRIQLKYDTYDNWKSKNPILKSGEVAIAAMSSNADGVKNAPNVIIKVGDGTHNYNDLKFASALAADVHEWAKKDEYEFRQWLMGQIPVEGTGGIDVSITNTSSDGELKLLVGHADTSDQASVAAASRTYVSGVTLDEYGHVTKITTGKETVTNTTYTFAAGTNGSFKVTPSGGSAQTVSVGKPSTAGTADKVANKVFFGSTSGKSYDGSASVTIAAGDIGAYTKSEVDTKVAGVTPSSLGVYTKAEVNSLHADMKKANMQVVEAKPTTGSEGIIYLVGSASPYEMFIYEGNAWISLGDTDVDLSNYYTKSETATQITNAINALDSSKTVATSGNFITGITITNGKITAITEAKPTDNNTVREIKIDGTSKMASSDKTALNLKSGNKISITEGSTNGDITISHTAVDGFDGSSTSGRDVAPVGFGGEVNYTVPEQYDVYGHVTSLREVAYALPDIAAGTGIKVTKNTAKTLATVEIDDSVTFVLNCGTASTVI